MTDQQAAEQTGAAVHPGTVDERLRELMSETAALQPITLPLLEATDCFLSSDAAIGPPGGEVVLRAGEQLVARQAVRLAAYGVMSVVATPRPRVVVVLPEAQHDDAKQARSTALLLAAAAQESGGIVYRAGTAPLDARALRDLIEDQLVRADLLLVVGDEDGRLDPLHDAVAELGRIEVHEIVMWPGPRHGFGRLGDESTPLFVLPSDPMAAFTIFEVFVRPVLRLIAADPSPFRRTVRARAAMEWHSPGGVQEFRFGSLTVAKGSLVFSPVPAVGPLAQLSAANAIASVPADRTRVPRDSPVLVIPLDGVGT